MPAVLDDLDLDFAPPAAAPRGDDGGDLIDLGYRPIFREHTNKLGVKFDRFSMQRICDKNNERIRKSGDFAPLAIGHTVDDNSREPELIGFVGPYRLQKMPDGTTAVAGKFRVYREDVGKVRKFPRCSVEFWANTDEPDVGIFDPVCLLGSATPELDLGIFYSKRGGQNMVRYQASFESGGSLSQADLQQIVAALEPVITQAVKAKIAELNPPGGGDDDEEDDLDDLDRALAGDDSDEDEDEDGDDDRLRGQVKNFIAAQTGSTKQPYSKSESTMSTLTTEQRTKYSRQAMQNCLANPELGFKSEYERLTGTGNPCPIKYHKKEEPAVLPQREPNRFLGPPVPLRYEKVVNVQPPAKGVPPTYRTWGERAAVIARQRCGGDSSRFSGEYQRAVRELFDGLAKKLTGRGCAQLYSNDVAEAPLIMDAYDCLSGRAAEIARGRCQNGGGSFRDEYQRAVAELQKEEFVDKTYKPVGS